MGKDLRRMTLQGDYEKFFAETIRSLERYAVRWVGDSVEGENIAGEVMLLVYSRWDDLGELPRQAVKAFAYRSAAFKARNHLRLKSRTEIPIEGAMALSACSGIDPMTCVDLMTDLTKVIEAMPGHLSETVRLRLFAELSFAEIGGILEIPEGTARRRFHDGVLRMRRDLDQYVR